MFLGIQAGDAEVQGGAATQEVDYAWAAGIVDGEGCIHIRRAASAAARFPSYQLRLQVSSTTMPMLLRLRRLFGGGIYQAGHSRKAHWRQNYVWSIVGWHAKQVLSLIEPHLTVKRAQAQVASFFPAGQRGRVRCPLQELGQALGYLAIRRLNAH